MKNVAVVNVLPSKSTGLIAKNLYQFLKEKKYNPYFSYCLGSSEDLHFFDNRYRIGSRIEHKIHKLLANITGLQGYFSVFATIRFLRYLRKRKIDTIFLLNIHQWFINERMLLKYIAHHNIALVYIMIDEYAFLGRCCFTMGCDNYIKGCGNCPSIKRYPPTWFFDCSSLIFQMKKRMYSQLNRAVFVGPAPTVELSKKSPIMQGVRTMVLDEAVDLTVYKPMNTMALKESLGISKDKTVLVCAAPFSDPRKGCQYFLKLAFELENDDRFVFVQVGFDGKDIVTPRNYIKVGYINNQTEYAEYLSMADVLVFLSLADTMSNTCIAALGCGTPLLCFNISGMPYLGDSSVLTLVEPYNVEQLKSVVLTVPQKNDRIIKTCREYAEKRYDQEKYNARLIELAESL